MLSRMLNASQPDTVEFNLTEITSDVAAKKIFDTTVCLDSRIVNGNRLEFYVSPLLQNDSSSSSVSDVSPYNMLGHIRNQIDTKNGQRFVIMKMTQTHVHNELGMNARFCLTGLFDVDKDTELVRRKVDGAVALNGADIDLIRRTKPEFTATQERLQNHTDNDNNNNDTETSRYLSDPNTDNGDMSVAIDVLMDSSATGEGDIALEPFEEVLKTLESISQRGRTTHRNNVERENELILPLIKPNQTCCDSTVLYKASVSHQTAIHFAGQETMIMEDPTRLVVGCAQTPEQTSGKHTKVINYVIYPAGHSLIVFINLYEDALDILPHEYVVYDGNRLPDQILYKVSNDLVNRSREAILYMIYAQIYYTTLQSCAFCRLAESDDKELAILRQIADDWNLKVDAKTGKISDWQKDQYRPKIIITLRVEGYMITHMESSAATLHKKKTLFTRRR